MYSRNLERQRKYQKDFEKISKPLPSLISAFHSFHKAQREAEIVANLSPDTSSLITAALLGSMIVSYSKPFLQGTDKRNTVLMSQKYLTKNNDFDSNIHSALLEIRNNLIAHANRDFEKQEFRIITALIESNVANSKVKQVYFPMKFLAHNESLLTINSKQLGLIRQHLQNALELTSKEIAHILVLVRDLMIENIDISNCLDEVIALDGEEILSLDERALQMMVFLDVDEATKFKLGKNSVSLEQFHIARDIPYIENFENDICAISCKINEETGFTNIQVRFKS